MTALLTSLLGNPLRTGLIAAVLGLSAYIWGVPVIGGGLLAKIEHKNAALLKASTDLRMAEGNLLTCVGDISRQNAVIDAMNAKGDAATARASKALREAQRANTKVDEAIGQIRGRKVEGCETGGAIISSGL